MGGVKQAEESLADLVGCRPEYMPVLIAVTKAMAEPRFNLFGAQTSTHNTSVLTLVNGPLREELDINWGYNVVGSRWHSTATLGRALNFIVTNIHTQGHIGRYQHMIAKNEAENPWEPLHVERGFEAKDSTVTVFAACPAMMIDDNSGSRSVKELMMTFACSVAYVGNRNINGEGEPLIILGPQHAGWLAREGYSKRDLKWFMWEPARVPFKHIPTGNLQSYSERFHKFYVDVAPDAGVPIVDAPEDIAVIVMGGRGRTAFPYKPCSGRAPRRCSLPARMACLTAAEPDGRAAEQTRPGPREPGLPLQALRAGTVALEDVYVDYSAPLEAVQASLWEQGLSDGLPVIPSTPERIAEMLSGRSPGRVVARLAPALGEASLFRLAFVR